MMVITHENEVMTVIPGQIFHEMNISCVSITHVDVSDPNFQPWFTDVILPSMVPINRSAHGLQST
jgi:hypothetical protein